LIAKNMKTTSTISKILRLVLGILLYSERGIAFSPNHSSLLTRFTKGSTTACRNWLGELWEELIEFSTYGPAERAALKAQREKAAAEGGDVSMDSFQRAQQKFMSKPSDSNESSSSSSSSSTTSSSPSVDADNALSAQAFQSAVASSGKKENTDGDIDFDGYKLRDLLVQKWGVQLDVDFQRGYGGGTVYCTVLPVAFGSRRCRHESELDYLMHLQAVVGVLKKYDNLDPFIFFVQSTNKQPKPGVESAPFLMKLNEDQLKAIL